MEIQAEIRIMKLTTPRVTHGLWMTKRKLRTYPMTNNWSTILPVATERLPAPPPHRKDIQPTRRIGIRESPRRHNGISIMKPFSKSTRHRAIPLIDEILLAGELLTEHHGPAHASGL